MRETRLERRMPLSSAMARLQSLPSDWPTLSQSLGSGAVIDIALMIAFFRNGCPSSVLKVLLSIPHQQQPAPAQSHESEVSLASC